MSSKPIESVAQLTPLFRKAYLLGGNAIFTIVSKVSSCRFTYKVRAKDVEKDRRLYFVNVLTGPENTNDYRFIGTIFPDGTFKHGSRSTISADAKSVKAFNWLWTHLDDEERIEVWHSGRCSRCRRLLTDPQSIERGIGPVCAGRD